MSNTEDEKSRKTKAPRAPRAARGSGAPRAKKLASAVAASVQGAGAQITISEVINDPTPSNDTLETPTNRESTGTVASVAVAEMSARQPLGANLSNYASPSSTPPSAAISVVTVPQPEAPQQLVPMQRPKISPLAAPTDTNSNSATKLPSVAALLNTTMAANTTIDTTVSVPSSLLNTPQEAEAIALNGGDKRLPSDSDYPKVAQLSSDKNTNRNPKSHSSNEKAASIDLRFSAEANPSQKQASGAGGQTQSQSQTSNKSSNSVSKPVVSAVQPGVMLQRAREARGLSVADVASRLRMGNRQVLALEAGQFEELPEGTFLRGFARNFSKVVGADTDAVLAALEAVNPDAAAPSTGIAPPAQNIKFSQHRPEPSRFSPKIGLLALIAVALSGAAWYWFEYVRNAPITGGSVSATLETNANTNTNATSNAIPSASRNANESTPNGLPTAAATATDAPLSTTNAAQTLTPPAPASGAPVAATSLPSAVVAPSNPAANFPIQVDRLLEKSNPNQKVPTASALAAPVAAVTVPSAQATATSITPKPGNSTLSFVFTDTSWVEVADARGNLIVNRTFKKGESHQVEGRTPFSIVVGNASNATMQYNGTPFDLVPHTKVSVARLRLK